VRRLAGLVDKATGDAWNQTTRNAGRVNAVEFAERFTIEIIQSFWGLDGAAAKSEVVAVPEGLDTLRMWLRRLAAVLTSTEPAPFGLWQVGWLCRREYLDYIAQACRQRAARAPGGDDVLSQLTFLKLPGSDPSPTPDEIARNIGGLIVTGSAVVTKAFAHALEQVLMRETPRRGLIAAARAGRRDEVRRFLIEGLRFKPVFPMLARRSVRATTLARGTPREADVPAGATVYLSPIGAMFDASAVNRPEAFDERREFDSNPWLSRQNPSPFRPPNPYLIFGFGAHWCPADELALEEITALAMKLLAEIPAPRLVAPMRYDGPAARELFVEGR
jgi:cytochrome P450